MLLKLGISWRDLQEMPEPESDALLLAYHELLNPPKGKKLKVRKP